MQTTDITRGMEGGEEETVGMKVDMKMQFNNPGQPVEFTLPSTEGYEEF